MGVPIVGFGSEGLIRFFDDDDDDVVVVERDETEREPGDVGEDLGLGLWGFEFRRFETTLTNDLAQRVQVLRPGSGGIGKSAIASALLGQHARRQSPPGININTTIHPGGRIVFGREEREPLGDVVEQFKERHAERDNAIKGRVDDLQRVAQRSRQRGTPGWRRRPGGLADH